MLVQGESRSTSPGSPRTSSCSCKPRSWQGSVGLTVEAVFLALSALLAAGLPAGAVGLQGGNASTAANPAPPETRTGAHIRGSIFGCGAHSCSNRKNTAATTNPLWCGACNRGSIPPHCSCCEPCTSQGSVGAALSPLRALQPTMLTAGAFPLLGALQHMPAVRLAVRVVQGMLPPLGAPTVGLTVMGASAVGAQDRPLHWW